MPAAGRSLATPDFEELTRVQLLTAVNAEGGKLPAGASGTVVHRYHAGQAFEVEFVEPFWALVTLEPEQIAQAD